MAVFRGQRLNPNNGIFADYEPSAGQLITASGTGNAQNATGAGDVLVGPPEEILASGTGNAQNATGAGSVDVTPLITAEGTGNAQNATGSGNVDSFFVVTASGTGSAQNATGSGNATILGLITASGTGNAQSATGSGDVERIVIGSGTGNAQNATGVGNVFLKRLVEAFGTANAQNATGSGTVGGLLEPPFDLRLKTPTGEWVEVTNHANLKNILPDSHDWWQGEWVGGQQYLKGHVIEDQGWLMIANQTTTERPAPQPIGEAGYAYTGTLTPNNANADITVVGRYTPQIRTQIVTGYRIYTDAGHSYNVYSVEDPTSGAPIITQLVSFTADSTGWQEFGLNNFLLEVGETVDFVAVITVTGQTTWQEDIGFWVVNDAVKGGVGVGVPYENIVYEDSQFNIDIQVQEYDTSDHWDYMSVGGTFGGGSGGGLEPHVLNYHDDVTITTPTIEQSLTYNGTQWVNADKIENAPGSKFVKLTQAQYDALGPGRDSNIMYIVVG